MQRVIRKELRTVLLSIFCSAAVWCSLAAADSAAADKFRPFKLKALDGSAKTLLDFANKATLVGFFYPRCPYCNKAIPEVQRIYETYKDRGLSVVLINVVPDENKLIPDWQAKYHVTVPVLIGASQDSLQRDYRLIATPTHYLLGEKGEVLFHQSGYKPGDEKLIEMKIAEALSTAMSPASPEKP